MQAAYMGHTAVMIRLLAHPSYHHHRQQKKKDNAAAASLVDEVDADGHTALYWASDYGHTGE